MIRIKNYSSHLFVEHSYLRLQDVFSSMKKETPAYIKALKDGEAIQENFEYAAQLKTKFDDMVVVGIGGSHLGAESFIKALSFPRNVTFMENPDPVGLDRRFGSLNNVERTHFVFVSKSGSTYETLAIANWILDQLATRSLSAKHHCTVVTTDDSQSALKNWALSQGVSCISAPEDLSGRYSVLSPAGLLPIYFAIDVEAQDISKNALRAFEDEKDLLHYSTLLFTAIQKKYRVLNLWTYSDQMQSFSKWWRQLWSESLGHQLAGEPGRIPICVLCRGASDQHSYLQQVIDQKEDQLNVVLTVKKIPNEYEHLKLSKDHFESSWNLSDYTLAEIFNRESMGLIKTFEELGIPYLHIEIDHISIENLSYFAIQQQLAVSMIGHALGINPYIQPAVEEMKLRIQQLSFL